MASAILGVYFGLDAAAIQVIHKSTGAVLANSPQMMRNASELYDQKLPVLSLSMLCMRAPGFRF